MGVAVESLRALSRWTLLTFGIILALLPAAARAQYVLEDVHDPKRYEPGPVVVPIGYRSGSISAALGAAVSERGLIQPQENSFAFGIGSTNGSYGGVMGMSDLQICPLDRLFFGWQVTYFRTEHDENTVDGNLKYRFENAGTNNSRSLDVIHKASNDAIGDFNFKFLLPIGDGREHIIDHYLIEEGLLVRGESGGDAYDPFESGRTFLEVRPFLEYLNLRAPYARQSQWDTNGFRFSAVYDNRDFVLTPSRGNMTQFTLDRDFGVFGSSSAWTNISAEFSQYISLGKSSLFRQEVLALDAWTSYSTTWKQNGPPGNRSVSNAPPFYEGAQLGGMQRMRGFPEERFHDRAGAFGSLELRLIPTWNPLAKIAILKPADLAWMQFVVFVEAGRVADEYTFDKLFSHMKGDGGVGVRFLTQDTVLRIDVAGSNEGIQVWANMDQAF